MLDVFKKVAIEQAGKLMSSPTATKVLTNPNVQRVMQKYMVKAFELQAVVRREVEEKLAEMLKSFNVVTADDLNKVKRSVQKLEAAISKLKRQVGKLEKKLEEKEAE